MGNICRSPMAERLLAHRFREAAGDHGDALLHSHSAGTGGWHAGEAMNPPAARQVRARGGDDAGFAARRLRPEHIDAADLVLTATADQSLYVTALRPDAGARTFVVGEFGRLLVEVDPGALLPAAATAEAVHARGVGLVAAINALRGEEPPRDSDDVDDPWGRGDHTFGRVADEIDEVVQRLVALLVPADQTTRT
jgi:protein-tyrosine phosphatase